jgi:hypothetical protein
MKSLWIRSFPIDYDVERWTKQTNIVTGGIDPYKEQIPCLYIFRKVLGRYPVKNPCNP